MKNIWTIVVAIALLACPAMSMAATTYTGTLKASDFKIQGPDKHLWKGKKGVLVKWSVTDHGGSYSYNFAISGKKNKKLKRAIKRVLIQTSPVAGASAPLSTIGGLSKFETGFQKKANVNFTSNVSPATTWLKLKGHGIRASTRFSFNILPLIDDTLDNGPYPYPGEEGDTSGSVVPAPASVWAGLVMLGGLAIVAVRRKRRLA